MTPEEHARQMIDQKLEQSGWIIQDMKRLNLSASAGVAVREFPTSTGEVDYALFVDGTPVGVIEAKRSNEGGRITSVEVQSARYANSTFKRIRPGYQIRFAYEATDKLVRFTDYQDIKCRSRTVFSFHRPETLRGWLAQKDTVFWWIPKAWENRQRRSFANTSPTMTLVPFQNCTVFID